MLLCERSMLLMLKQSSKKASSLVFQFLKPVVAQVDFLQADKCFKSTWRDPGEVIFTQIKCDQLEEPRVGLNRNVVNLVFGEAEVENDGQATKGFFPQTGDVVLVKVKSSQ